MKNKYAYLLRTISELVCSSQFYLSGRYVGGDSPFCITSPPNTFPELENKAINILTSDETISELIVKYNFNVSTREAIDEMYAHLSHGNDIVAQNIIRIISNDIWDNRTTFDEIIKYNNICKNLARIKISRENITTLTQYIFEDAFLEEKSSYIKYSDSILNLILDIIKRNKDACRYLRNIPDGFSQIQSFHEKYPIPMSKGKSLHLFKKVPRDRIERYLAPEDKEKIWVFSSKRLSEFEHLLIDTDYEDTIRENLSNEVYSELDDVLDMDSYIDYYKDEYKFWVEATVKEDYGAILLVSYKNPLVVIKNPINERTDEMKDSIKINKDSWRPAGLYTSNSMHQVNGIYEYIYSKIKPKRIY